MHRPKFAKTKRVKALLEEIPGLRQLESDIRACDGRAADFCANQVWERTFLPHLAILMAIEYPRPLKGFSADYRHIYYYLYDLLPDCGDCGDCGCEREGVRG